MTHTTLTIVLKSKDETARQVAAKILGEISDAQAVESLVGALEDEDRNMRQSASQALVRIGSPAVEPLTIVLKNKDVAARQVAAKTLGEISDAQAVESLIVALEDEDEDIRWNVAEALDKCGWQPGGKEAVAYWVAKRQWDKCIEMGVPIKESLITALESRDSTVREGAAKALGKLDDTRAIEGLISALRDEEWVVRNIAAKALSRVGDARATGPLVDALEDNEPGGLGIIMRRDAARALGRIGGSQAVEALITSLKDKEQSVREVAAEALGQIGDARAVKPLISVLITSFSESVRKASVVALGQIGDKRAVPALIVVLEERERQDMASVVGLMKGAGQYGEFLKGAIVEVRGAAVKALKSITGQDFGEDAVAWEKWWKDRRARMSSG